MRVYATALVIELLTGWSLGHSILVIAAFAILWTWMGGVAAVIWTDVVQFFVLIIGALAALFLITTALPDGWSSLVSFGQTAGKFRLLDFTTDPQVAFTFWAALLPYLFRALPSTVQTIYSLNVLCAAEMPKKPKRHYFGA